MNDYEIRRRRPPTLSHRVEYYSMRAMIAGLERVNWSTACRIGEKLGEMIYRPLGIRRMVVVRQIAAAFPELPAQQVEQLARACYRHLGRTAVEAALSAKVGRDDILALVERVDGWSHIDGSADSKGAILVAAHHGNWELLGAYLAARGLHPVVVVRGADNRLFEDYLNANRQRLGLEIVHDTIAVKRITRGLREGRYVAMLADQGVLGLASSFVPFFGRPAKTPRGFAVFALRFDVPVIFMDMIRLPDGRFRAVFERVDVERTGDRDTDTDAMVAEYSRILEKWVREYPEQYFWQHRRWRRQPEGTPVELRDPALEDPSAWTPSR
ncbi:MAG TPA: lysophospholipid acyltransferase family protein [Gemmatimonadaceae bacterium]|nr:lysophospholipid acyltransferase family protein [Gemmatimonadaceae bacterium]